MIEKYFFYFIKIIKSLLTRPIQTLKWIRVDYKKDLSCRNFKSQYHFVWCAGLPKSGTTLVEQIFDNLPYVRQNNSFNRVYYTGKLDHDHGISNEMFKNYSKTKYTFLKTHTHYDKKYEDIAINNPPQNNAIKEPKKVTVSATLPPRIVLEKTSLPKLSVPNQNSEEGS